MIKFINTPFNSSIQLKNNQMTSNQQQYEEQFDFLVLDDIQDSTIQNQSSNNQSNPVNPTHTKHSTNYLQTKPNQSNTKINDQLNTLHPQGPIQQTKPQQTHPQYIKASNHYSMGKDTLKYSEDSNMSISQKDTSPLANLNNLQQPKKPSSNDQMLMSHTDSLMNNSKHPQIQKFQAGQSEISLVGNRQPQRRLIRKPLVKIQTQHKPQILAKTQQFGSKDLRAIEQKSSDTRIPQKQIQFRSNPAHEIKQADSKPLDNKDTHTIQSKENPLIQNQNNLHLLNFSLKSNLADNSLDPTHQVGQKQKDSSIQASNFQNITLLPSHPLQSKGKDLIEKKSLLGKNDTELQDFSIMNDSKSLGNVIMMNSKGQLQLIPEDKPLKPESQNIHMDLSITKPKKLDQNTQKQQYSNQIAPEPHKDPLEVRQIINEANVSLKQHREEPIDSVIGLLNMGNRKQLLQGPSYQPIKLSQSSTISVTNPIHLAQQPINNEEKKSNPSSVTAPTKQQQLQHSHTTSINTTDIKNQPISQAASVSNSDTRLLCSIIQLTQCTKQLQKPIFAINQLCNFANNPQLKCSKLSQSIGQSNLSAVKYFGYSWTDIEKSDSNNNHSGKPHHDKSMLFGPKAKFMREIQQQQQESKSLKQNKNFYLYLEPSLLPLTKDSLKISQKKQPRTYSFHTKFNFHQRVDLVIDLLQTLFIVHKQGFMVFPNSLFPQKNSKQFLFAVRHQQSQSKEKTFDFLPQIKFAVHSLQPFKHLQGTTSHPFQLKQFISKILNIQNKSSLAQQLLKQNGSLKQQKIIAPELKSPEIRFFGQDWYWEVWNKSVDNSGNKQTSKIFVQKSTGPKWLDLFQIPLTCLKLIFGEEIISALIKKKYQEIIKTVNRIKPKQKPKTSEIAKINNKFDPTLLAKPEQAAKEKLQLASQLLAQSFLTPKIQEEILKLCQQPLISWIQFQQSYKQFNQQNQRAPQVANKQPTPKSSNQQSILTNPDSKKIFLQISHCISLLPFHISSQGKYQSKRLSSLKDLYDKLLKFKTPQKIKTIVPPVFHVKKNPKLQAQIKQKASQQNEGIKPNQQQKQLSEASKDTGLTVLSSQSTSKTLIQLKKQYISLLQSNKTLSREQFESDYIKKPQTHLLNQQIRKKLSAAFLSHSGIMKSPKSFTLIYKSSVFNFATKKFYNYCENKQRLLYVMKIKNQRTLLYYNEEKIVRNKQMNGLFGSFVKDNKGTSFIYTGDEVLKVKNVNKAFAVSHIHGPIIGEGDIVVKEGNIDNECNYPKSYETGKRTPKLLKGSKFVLDQMDVYEVSF